MQKKPTNSYLIKNYEVGGTRVWRMFLAFYLHK